VCCVYKKERIPDPNAKSNRGRRTFGDALFALGCTALRLRGSSFRLVYFPFVFLWVLSWANGGGEMNMGRPNTITTRFEVLSGWSLFLFTLSSGRMGWHGRMDGECYLQLSFSLPLSLSACVTQHYSFLSTLCYTNIVRWLFLIFSRRGIGLVRSCRLARIGKIRIRELGCVGQPSSLFRY